MIHLEIVYNPDDILDLMTVKKKISMEILTHVTSPNKLNTSAKHLSAYTSHGEIAILNNDTLPQFK